MRDSVLSSVVSIAACCGGLFGQHPAAAPPAVEVKRVPAAKKQIPPLLQKYDFGEQLRVLENPPSTASPSRTAKGDAGLIPTGNPQADIPLNPTALEAVRVSETWRPR